MKLIHLKNLKREFVLVELARYVAHFEYACGSDGIYLQWHDGQIDEFEGCIGEHGQIKLSDNPRDSFKRLGKFTDLKEEDFYYLVDSVEQHGSWPYVDIYFLSYKDSSYSCCTPKESFISAIEAEGWYTENPITNPYEQFHWCEEWKQNAIKYYNEAQEKVINLSNCYLFFKL